jgi:hypothetical protein
MLSGTTRLVIFAIAMSLLATLALRIIKRTASDLFSSLASYSSGSIPSGDVLNDDISDVLNGVANNDVDKGKTLHHLSHFRDEYECAKLAIEDSLRKAGDSLPPTSSQDVVESRHADAINIVIDNFIEALVRNDVPQIRSLATSDLRKTLTVTAIHRLLKTAPASLRNDRILKVSNQSHVEVWTNRRLLTLIRTASSEWKICEVW